ncbi:MAG: MFS transporter [Parachlamydia sp.]|jgi:DHA1 family tetracycline resistance protein-like MFS transporter|nr:MFS transporter [Parachlamydia sp.]
MVLFLGNGIICNFANTQKNNGPLRYSLWASLSTMQKVLAWPDLRWLFTSVFAFAFGWSFFNEFIPLLLKDRFQFELSDIGNYYAYGGAWYALCSGVFATWLLKYFSPEKIVPKALFGCFLCMLMFALIEERQVIWLVVPFLMFFLSFTYPATASMVSNSASSDNQGEILGIYQSVVGCAMGLSPFIVGSAIGMYPVLTPIGGALAMLISALAFLKGTKISQKAIIN